MSSQSSKSTRAEREAQRKAAAAQARKAQQSKERVRTLIGAGATLLVLAALVVAIVFGVRSNDAKPSSGGDQILPAAVTGTTPTAEAGVSKIANVTGIDGVVAYNTGDYPSSSGTSAAGALPHTHMDGPITYTVIPPVGGDHNGTWMNAGVYTEPVPTERAVHNLEHGAVWITYQPGLPADQIKALQDFVGKQSLIDEGQYGKNRFMDLSPWADDKLPAPIVISSWGYQLYVTSPTDPRLQQFVNKFRHSQQYSPEYGSPVDGVPVSIGGRPAIYGGTQANPAN